MIDEEFLEAVFMAVRTLPFEVAREHMRKFAVSCRHDGMLDFVRAQGDGGLGKLKQDLEVLRDKMETDLSQPALF